MQTVFKRYELKYLLTKEQKDRLMNLMKEHTVPDRYGATVIRNLYFDTPNYRLIRRSIERPTYKEKLRIRSYSTVESRGPVFVELKKKYNKVVYKRRLVMEQQAAMDWLSGKAACPLSSQIAGEVDYFLQYYGELRPVVFLSYRREAFYAREVSELRVTFDEDIMVRCHDLSLTSEPGGVSILPTDHVLMEIKCAGGIPLWLTHVLSQEKIYKTSFSKYGTAYQTLIYPKLTQEGFDHGNTIQRTV